MTKSLYSILLIVSSVISPAPVTPDATKNFHQQITESEAQEAREVGRRYTRRLIETQDLAPVIRDLYFADFIARYKKAKSEDLSANPVDLYLAPGLEYNSRLLSQANADEWQRLYVAVNNFLIFGFFSAMTKYSEENPNIAPTDMFPASVIELLNKDPNLANTIVRKGRQKAISSVEEMRNASSTLEQAVAMMRKTQPIKASARIQGRELGELMKSDEIFVSQLEAPSREFFGFPAGTRIIYIDTLLGRRLLLARDNNNKLKVFWSDIITE
jgi:hypothetical protein